jgi:hypothetical protein
MTATAAGKMKKFSHRRMSLPFYTSDNQPLGKVPLQEGIAEYNRKGRHKYLRRLKTAVTQLRQFYQFRVA